MPIVKAALAVDDPVTGETVVIIINQALYFGYLLSHVLLNPNQLRANDITVDDIPQHLSPKSMHSITIHEENFSIPLAVCSFFIVLFFVIFLIPSFIVICHLEIVFDVIFLPFIFPLPA